MSYFELQPSLFLRPYIDCYWLHSLENDDSGFREQSCLPLGTVELIIQVNQHPSHHLNKNGVWEKSQRIFFAGLYDHPVVWKAGASSVMFGIRLKPESLITLFRFPVSLLNNIVADAEALMGPWIKAMGEEMCNTTSLHELATIAERHLLKRLETVSVADGRFAAACRLLRDQPINLSITGLSEHLSIGKRQLERVFKDQLGTSPKTYQRIIRFTKTYHHIRVKGNTPWTDITYDNGYSDQSHFIRDFKEFSGELPSEFVSRTQSFSPQVLSITTV